MAEVDIVFQDGETFLPLFFDIDKEQRHSIRATKTEFPIERGADRSDHHRAVPDEYSEDLVISDTQLDNSHVGTELTRRRDAWALLIDARDRHLPCVVVTPLRTYDDMVLLEATASRTAADGTWLRVSVHFGQMQTFDTQLVDPTPTRPRDRGQTDLGTQSTTETSPQLTSLLQDGIDGYFGRTRP